MASDAGGRMRFGRYETLFKIAAGGMAEVYAARALGEAGFQKLVALKRMRPELAEDPRFVTMFLDEGRVAANIASPNVVATLDLGRADDNSLYLVMELVTGVALQDLIESAAPGEPPLPLPMAIEVLAQTANGLHDAHEAHSPTGEPLEIVHRDCSPHNILIDVRGRVLVTDFGIAKALERQTQSHAGEMKGKLCYLSPEQARGFPVDRRSDVFILGVVAFEALTGQQLFPANNAVEALHKVVAMDIPRVDQIRPEIPSDVAAAIAMALQRDPDQRFATAAAFANALMLALPERAPRRDIGEFVRHRGGGPLAKMEARVRQALLEAGVTPSRPSDLPPRLEPAPAVPTAREAAKTEEAPAPPRRERSSTQPLLLRASRVKTAVLEAPAPRPTPVAPRPSRGRWFAAAAALGLLSFAGAAWAAWSWSRPIEPPHPPPIAGPAAPQPVASPTRNEPPPGQTPTELTPTELTPTERRPSPEAEPSVAHETAPPSRPTTDSDAPPRAGLRRGRRRRPVQTADPEGTPEAPSTPNTVGGHVHPRGDRAQALDEIPW